MKISIGGIYKSTIRHVCGIYSKDCFVPAFQQPFALDIGSIMNGETSTSVSNGYTLRANAAPFPFPPHYAQYQYVPDYTAYAEPNVGSIPMGMQAGIPPQATMLPQQSPAAHMIAPRDFTGTPDTSMSVSSKRPHASNSVLQTIQVDTPAPGPPPVLRSPENLRCRSPSLYGMRNDIDKVLDKVTRLNERSDRFEQ